VTSLIPRVSTDSAQGATRRDDTFHDLEPRHATFRSRTFTPHLKVHSPLVMVVVAVDASVLTDAPPRRSWGQTPGHG
jgi:hypothetical protein